MSARQFGFDNLTHACVPAPEFVSLAAGAGASTVSLFLRAMAVGGQPAAPPLVDDPALQAETLARLDANGMSVGLIEGMAVMAEFSKDAVRQGLEVALKFGRPLIGTLVFDPEPARAEENFAWLQDQVSQAGLNLSLEFTPLSVIPDLAAGAAWARRHGCKMTLDTLHLERSGGTAEDVAALQRDDPGRVAYIQLCDGPRGRFTDMQAYWNEALNDRGAAGDGAIPLTDVVRAAGEGVILSHEIPSSAVTRGDLKPQAHFARIAAGTRALLARV